MNKNRTAKNIKMDNKNESESLFKKATIIFIVILITITMLAIFVGIISESDSNSNTVVDNHESLNNIEDISNNDNIANNIVEDYIDESILDNNIKIEFIDDEQIEYTGEKLFEDVPDYFEDTTKYSKRELIKENITVDGKVHTDTNVEGEITNFPESTYKIINSGECIPILAGDYVVEEIVIDNKHIENKIIFNITYLDNSLMRNYGLTFENKEDKQSLYVGKTITVDKDSAAGVAGATIVLKRR